MPAWLDHLKRVSTIKRLALGLMLLAATFSVGVSVSCRRSAELKQPTPPRNLTPGLSEALTAFAHRHQGLLVLIDGSGNNEEAVNLADLMAKAFEAGGWGIIRSDVSVKPTDGLYCNYEPDYQDIADDLVSVLEKKGLSIKCVERHGDLIHLPVISLVVGLKP